MTKPRPLVNTGHHVHVHKWEGDNGEVVERRFEHSHPYPKTEMDGARPHAHSNGRHSHPHGHAEYAA